MSDREDQGGSLSAYEATPVTMPVVGVGVSAASLRSLEALFAGMVPALSAAFVVAVRQQEGLDVTNVVDALRRQVTFPVQIGRDGDRLEADHIYVGGANDIITVRSGCISIRPAIEPVGHRGVVDTMLISLAEHAHERAVAVILDGLGSDGTAGVTATKKCGGLSIGERGEQDDESAQQGVSGAFGVVDLHLPVDRIPTQIALYLNSVSENSSKAESEETSEQIEAHVAQITTILRNVTGNDFHGYKRGTFLRRVHRRLQVLQLDTLDAYVAHLREDRQEAQNLFQDLLIGVTQFFRDPLEFEVLEGELPRLFEGKGADDQLRIWVLGCATGEEAYSLAILLREQMATMAQPPQVQIFATDLDARALGLARAGRYSTSIADHVRPDRLIRWFTHEGDTYCVSKELREMCIFSPHNIIKDAPFSRIDILSCRNLLIYLNADIQNRVIPLFHFSLRPGGVLFLGNSENVTRHQKLFAPIDRRNRVYRRIETATRIVPEFPLSARPRVADALQSQHADQPAPARLSSAVGRQAEAIAERHAPAYVVVDAQGDVLHFSGRTGRFLEPVAGAASLNILHLVHRDLRIDLRSALHRAISDGRRVDMPRLTLEQDDRTTAVNVVVEPIGSGDVVSLVILFQDVGDVVDRTRGDLPRKDSELVERLESELRLTRDRLQATIEELESTNEELKSSNEEYQSINEELQSANEEMETSKEELQSVNEELQTVNGELGHRVSELSRSNSDLKNLLEATRIATLFLDNDLRVRSFTPSATEVFNLLETDIGRPLGHVVSLVAYPDLDNDVRRVLKTLVPVERTVIDPTNQRHFAAKVLPYRSVDNYINGAVVTFTDLTAVHAAETALRDSEKRMSALLSASSQSIFRMNDDWSEMIEMTGRGFLADTRNNFDWVDDYLALEDRAEVLSTLLTSIEERQVFELEHRVRRADGSMGWAMSRAIPILGANDEVVEWFGAASNITARRVAEEAMRESEERLHSLVEGLPQLVWRAVELGHWTWASRQWVDYTGQNERDSADWGWLEPLHPDDRPLARTAWSHAAEQGGFEVEFRIRRASDGAYRWFKTRAEPVRHEGEIVEWVGTSTDINELRDLQERQGVLVAELQHRTRNLIGVVRQVAQKTARSSADLEEFRERFRDRLDALARVQGLLSRLNDQDRVAFDELILSELAAHGSDPAHDGRVFLDGPAGVRLRSTTVQTLALALHELSTNAVKYGALGQPDAQLAISWKVEGDAEPWLHIDWRETRVRMGTNVPAVGGGQGRELIERALPYQLHARTTYVLEEDGVHCTVALPISATNSPG